LRRRDEFFGWLSKFVKEIFERIGESIGEVGGEGSKGVELSLVANLDVAAEFLENRWGSFGGRFGISLFIVGWLMGSDRGGLNCSAR